jgi:hypothetical protein
MIDARSITKALGGRWCGSYGLARCPTHDDRSPSLKVRNDARKYDGIDVVCFAGCDWQNVKAELRRQNLLDGVADARRSLPRSPSPMAPSADQDHAKRQLDKARWLWQRRKPMAGSPAERYLRVARHYRGFLPGLGFLPASKPEHHPAMIAAFGLPDEPDPDVLSLRDTEVRGVHLTLLRPDGSGKADTAPNKIIVGPSLGFPIVLAPINDGLGLAITEGVEDALSVHQATGLGVWAAGSASRLPALADVVPDYADCITIFGDADDAGQKGARELSERLTGRGLHVELACSEAT